MLEWNEETIRAAASWQAFKAGRDLLAGGLVLDAKRGDSGWNGAVKSGSKSLRVAVFVRSKTDLETRCACPDNRRSGELCAHAVAVGLAALKPQSPPPEKSISYEPPTSQAWSVTFPPNWKQSLSRNTLVCTLAPSARAIDPADERLNAWLTANGVRSRGTIPLQLSRNDLKTALRCLQEHPELRLQNGEDFRIHGNARLRVQDHAPDQQGRVNIKLSDAPLQNFDIGGDRFIADDQSLHCLADGLRDSELRDLLDHGEVEIDAMFLLRNLEPLQQVLEFDDTGWLASLHFVPADVSFLIELDGNADELTARVLARYDNCRVIVSRGDVEGLPRLRGDVCEVRNHAAESAAVSIMLRSGFSPVEEHMILHGRAAVIGFLADGITGLERDWSVTLTPQLKSLRERTDLVRPVVEDEGGVFHLAYQTSDGVPVSPEEVRRIMRGGSRSDGKGRQWVVSEEAGELVEPLLADLDLRQEGGALVADARSSEVLCLLRERLSGVSAASVAGMAFASSVSFQASLRAYQTHGAAWMADRCKRFGGALLADDMGLGKTVQTIAVIEAAFAQETTGPALVVATASLLGNWRAEFRKFAPSRTVRILHGAAREKEQKLVAIGDVVLTSYGTLSRDLAWHLRQPYQIAVADEASLMRNPDTDHAKAMAKLNAKSRIALTGTPLENGVRDLWSIFRFIQPGWLGGRNEFRDRYEVPLADETLAGSVLQRLRLKTSPFILRRTKDQVAPELPTKLVIDEFCELSPDQRSIYQKLAEEGRRRAEDLDGSGAKGASRMQVLTTLLRLRQACCDLALLDNERLGELPLPRRSAKMERLLELLEEAISGGHRVLVFSQFKSQLNGISAQLASRGTAHLQLDGGTRNRQELVDRFQSDHGPPVFLISLKAGGYGLNLTGADVVIHFDPWWNPAAEAQASDRAHRIGQTRPVTVYRLLTRNTVEEHVLHLQAGKRLLAEAIDEGPEVDASGLNDETLRSLLTGA